MRTYTTLAGLMVLLCSTVGFTQGLPPSPRNEPLSSTDKGKRVKRVGMLLIEAAKPPYLKALEGTWSAVSQTKDGKATLAGQLTEERLVIEGRHLRVMVNGKLARTEDHLTVRKGTAKPELQMVTFSPFAIPPKTIEIEGISIQVAPGVLAQGATPPKTIEIDGSLGIYEIEGDQLKICLAPLGSARPTEFRAPADSGSTLTIYKRVQADNKGK